MKSISFNKYFTIIKFTTSFFIFLSIFIFYSYLACPTVYWYDSGEFNAASKVLGVAHPTGYPLYIMLSKIWGSIIPFESPLGQIHNFAYRCNIMSGFFGAISSSLIFLIFCLLFIKINKNPDKESNFFNQDLTLSYSWKKNKLKQNIFYDLVNLKPTLNIIFIYFISIFIALFTVLGPVFTGQSVVSEVYTLNLFFILINIYLLLLWNKNESIWILYLFSFLFGLSHSNHMTSILMAPFYLFFIIYKLRTKFFHPKYIVIPLILFFIGFIPYLFVPVMSNNPVSWFPIKNFAEFKFLFLAESYKRSLFINKDFFIDTFGGLFSWSMFYIKTQVMIFWGFFLLLFIGMFFFVKNHFNYCIIIVGGFLIYLIYFANYMANNQDFYLPIFTFANIILGLFYLYFYSYFIENNKKILKIFYTVIFSLVLSGLLIYQIFQDFTTANKLIDIGSGQKIEGTNKHNYSKAFDNARKIIDSVPDNSTVIFHGDTMAAVLYLKYCTDIKINKNLYHSLLFHFKKYGPISGKSWRNTMNEELISPVLKKSSSLVSEQNINSNKVFVTLKDNSPQVDGVLYDMIKILNKQHYDITPVYINNEFYSLGEIINSYEPENTSFLEMKNILVDSGNFCDGLKSPIVIKDKNVYFKKLSGNDTIDLSIKKSDFNGITILCSAKNIDEKIEKILDIEINGKHYYLNNILDIFNQSINKDNYFPERKIINNKYSIVKKQIYLGKINSDKIKIKYLTNKGSINIYAIGLNF